MTITKSPTYWETLRRMGEGELRAAFQECAATDLNWAIDQAKCLSYHLAPDCAASAIVRDFCDQAAGLALKQGAADAAITALQIVADGPGADSDERAQAAVRNLRQALEDLAQTDRDQALGLTVLMKAKSWYNGALAGELADFLLSNTPPDADGMLINVIRGGENLPTGQLERLIDKTAVLAVHKPYKAHNAAIEILEGCHNLTEGQRDKLNELIHTLGNQPEVLKDILEQEYGEDLSAIRALQSQPKTESGATPARQYVPVPGSPRLQ